MPYFKASQDWLDQSALLLEARPSTTRVTTRYAVRPTPKKPSAAPTDGAPPPRATLVFKTYDPVSGITLKYRTSKAAEVSRLVYASLGKLGRAMAAVADEPPEDIMTDAPPLGAATERTGERKAAPTQAQQQQRGASGGGGGKKKRGKK